MENPMDAHWTGAENVMPGKMQECFINSQCLLLERKEIQQPMEDEFPAHIYLN